MRPKTKEFADKLLSDPKISHTRAYLETHETNNPETAKVEASKLLTKPNVQLYMRSHINKARRKIVDLIDADKPDIALKASQDVLDRSGYKAIDRKEVRQEKITISLGAEDVKKLTDLKPHPSP